MGLLSNLTAPLKAAIATVIALQAIAIIGLAVATMYLQNEVRSAGLASASSEAFDDLSPQGESIDLGEIELSLLQIREDLSSIAIETNDAAQAAHSVRRDINMMALTGVRCER